MAHIKNQLNIYTANTVPDWQNGKKQLELCERAVKNKEEEEQEIVM